MEGLGFSFGLFVWSKAQDQGLGGLGVRVLACKNLRMLAWGLSPKEGHIWAVLIKVMVPFWVRCQEYGSFFGGTLNSGAAALNK